LQSLAVPQAYNSRMRYLFLLAVAVGVIGMTVPATAHAAVTVNYVCTDFTLDAGITCTVATPTWTGGGAAAQGKAGTGGGHNWPNSSTLYYSATGSSWTGSGYRFKCSGDVNDGAYTTEGNGAVTAVSFTCAGGNTTNDLRISNQPNAETNTGAIATICVTDTSGACEGGGGGGGYDPTATSTLDQAQRNLAQGFWIYFAGFFGMIWLLRKP